MKRALMTIIAFFVLFALTNCTSSPALQAGPEKPRTIVTTDGEVDDMDTFIRLLLYTNEFDVEGFVYSSSQWHYAGDGKGTLFTSEMPSTKRYGERTDLRWAGTVWIQQLIEKYAESYPNLIKHDKNYPTPDYLKSIVKVGNIDFEGEMSKDTEGSDFIKKILLDDEPGPVYVQIWGGTNTLARALKSIEDEYKNKANWQDIYKKISEKAIIYTVLDQDATYTKYVAPNWPEIRVIYNSAQFWSFAYMWSRVVPDTLKPCMSGPWFKEYIKFNHGPLLENYYTWGDGQKIAGDPEHTQGDIQEAEKQKMSQYSFISEGDSPAYFFMLNYGLRSTEDPSFGGLGGRFIQSPTNPRRWEDGRTVTDFDPYTGKEESSYPQIRWIEDLQNDFAARADWCVKEYKNANHAPVVKLRQANSLSAKPGEVIQLAGTATDPDRNALTYNWWQYKEAGTCKEDVTIAEANNQKTSVTIPANAVAGKTIHLILEVADNGSPSLTRYQRVVITIL
jgi:hypothetical protein